jgi:hypothetical protein
MAKIKTAARGKSAKKIFVSYSHIHRDLVRNLVSFLQLARGRVFFDDFLKPGENWEDRLILEISTSSVVVLFWCAHARESQWTQREIDEALRLEKRIVPVLLDETEVPPALVKYQWLDFRKLVTHGKYEGFNRSLMRGAKLLRNAVFPIYKYLAIAKPLAVFAFASAFALPVIMRNDADRIAMLPTSEPVPVSDRTPAAPPPDMVPELPVSVPLGMPAETAPVDPVSSPAAPAVIAPAGGPAGRPSVDAPAKSLPSLPPSPAPAADDPSSVEPAPQPPPEKVPTIGAEALFTAFDDDEAAADKTFKGKLVQVTGRFDYARKDSRNSIYLTLSTDVPGVYVQCYFSNDKKAAIAKLATNQEIVVIGRCEGLFGNVMLKNCEFER